MAMKERAVSELLEGFGVIPVIAIESPERSIPLADALIEGDLPVVEITFRTKAAAEVIQILRKGSIRDPTMRSYLLWNLLPPVRRNTFFPIHTSWWVL